MFHTFLIVVLIVLCIVLVTVILMQAGKGGGLAASFGGAASSSDSFVGTRQAATLFTRISWYGGAAFLALGLLLQILSARATGVPASVLDRPFQTAPAVPGTPISPAEPMQPGTGVPLMPVPQGEAAPQTPPAPTPQP